MTTVIQKMFLVMLCHCLVFGSGFACADEIIWMRKSTFGGKTALMLSANKQSLYCVGCNFNDYGMIPIQRGVAVNELVLQNLDPWVSTLWVVLAHVSNGRECATGEWYTISLNTHNIERINTSVFKCADVQVSVAEKGLGMVVTMTDRQGHRVVTEAR